ncbi:tRNA threonylcarbamoyladenosine dehydratase [Bdellovibrio bacteriovorus]|uniref:THIF family protein n=1 Tax=Bdellovibrio bacteriovorus str. Tiberius TaxID=1069642 RepID=K7YZ71_BDEBC|nr:tRNA threonylcarbamoyladenosine dehydratase [Bdellovibrio bacteriovorus]AFY01990.1 THIF family protein [Bdellovibrio bacteriovorus str. Tiberius]
METTQSPNLPQPQETEYVLHRRFDRMGRLVGDEVMKRLFNTHVMVIGLGGVGSWAAESLARSGVGKLTIIDFDEICITNANRQLHALQGLVGKKKAEVMGERLRKINPQNNVTVIPEFYNAENSEMMLSHKPDYIVDAIDNLTAKTHLLATCRERGIKVITSGGSAAKMDPLRIKKADLADTYVDPMAAQVRKMLRQKYDFPEKNFGIPCIFSDETPIQPVELKYDHGQGFKCVCPKGQNDLHNCDSRNVIWGTASYVTGAFGLAMASHIVNEIHAQAQNEAKA